MRELKFRIWSEKEKKMFIVKNTFAIYDYTEKYFESAQIMQYTGLKDKCGKEIYEGDILDFEINNRQYRVFFNKCSFKIQRTDHLNRNLYLLEDYPTWDMKVVGNIFENPDLVKNI